ncbi:DNA-binding domain-containing protein [Marinobacterium aestuariivivens]|uniref:DUF2063 domain-containing protein n=1 Tax=Marinobacterium aestuariivivens TaxID=1698799 RepID=A0ABW2A8S7_9GAMM
MTGQRDFCKALLDPDQGTPDGLRSWNGSDPAMRFAVYRNNVIASLIEALADSFPVVKALVGDRFFDAMAQGFVRQNLPASPVLARYGDAFPAFVADFEPAGSLPYLADVARLEWFYVQAFHAADAQPVATEAIGRLLADSDALPGLRLGLHPSAALLCSDHAVVSIWAAHQGTGDLRRIDPGRPEQALLLRSGLEVQVLPWIVPARTLPNACCAAKALARRWNGPQPKARHSIRPASSACLSGTAPLPRFIPLRNHPQENRS